MRALPGLAHGAPVYVRLSLSSLSDIVPTITIYLIFRVLVVLDMVLRSATLPRFLPLLLLILRSLSFSQFDAQVIR